MFTQNDLDIINNKIPQNYLWDGFWIDSYKHKTLNISASFDKIYYRDIMIVYKGVSFFNLPYEWRDNSVQQPWMQLANELKFKLEYPNEDVIDKTIIEWQIFDSFRNVTESFFIVCKKIFVFSCNDEERIYAMDYTEPIANQEFMQKRMINRIPLLKK